MPLKPAVIAASIAVVLVAVLLMYYRMTSLSYSAEAVPDLKAATGTVEVVESSPRETVITIPYYKGADGALPILDKHGARRFGNTIRVYTTATVDDAPGWGMAMRVTLTNLKPGEYKVKVYEKTVYDMNTLSPQQQPPSIKLVEKKFTVR